jgi:hypothetical protein
MCPLDRLAFRAARNDITDTNPAGAPSRPARYALRLVENPVPTAIDGAAPVNNLKTTGGATASSAIHTDSQLHPSNLARRPTPMKTAQFH